ncbi:GNAT family N-acetyltransferase [Amycolatopsis sp. A133]|uniref:GNAT family N-acetyltransferase n=1 Tax=Amycolatopsis sp. A133 TaxID=3064472 RepID=UPI0027E6A39E|nr:GNAT family N-acetyltransferase [Amycolatopsis sp. A133]MDQ7804386.1 GNAT family N-acetyltransferase [Amycolatopsis sp. A133]
MTSLTPLDEPALARLLEAAVAGADPLEVMPPVDGPPGWPPARREAFLAFHRARSLDPATAVERTWVIDVDGAAVGAARLEPHGDAVEAGVWLSRDARGRGIGKQVAALLLAEARASGAARFVASTTAGNHGARALLAGLGAGLTTEGDEVTAELRLGSAGGSAAAGREW